MIQEGTLLAGKYRVERQLGAGGMGYVVAAIHEQLDQRVAVKLLVPELCENKDAVLRFLREARAAVRIRSEHVARVLDVDELDTGAPYMVMEFLSGQDLARELDELGYFEPRVAIDYLLQVCEAVAEAHSLGVIHRDLKPANLFLTRRADGSPLVKVLDFGISKAISSEEGDSGESLTAPQGLLGSPAYMSPEQIRRPKTVDIRTDIWSLGAILYEFLTGESPFRGDTPLSVLAAVVSDPFPSLREKNPAVPQELESIVAKCLEKDPDNRYQTVAEFAQALAPYAPSAALSSITRIAGILRWSSSAGGPASTTLRSATSLPPGLIESERPPSERTQSDPPSERQSEGLESQKTQAAAAEGTSADKHTQTDWGTSQSIKHRTRLRARLLIGAGALAVALLLLLVLRPFGRDSAEPPAVNAAAMSARVKDFPTNQPLPTISAESPARVLPVLAAPSADAAPQRVRPAESSKPKAPKSPSSAPLKSPSEQTARPAAKPATTQQPTDDPLEGRR